MGGGKGTMLGEFIPLWASGTHRTTQGYNAHELRLKRARCDAKPVYNYWAGRYLIGRGEHSQLQCASWHL